MLHLRVFGSPAAMDAVADDLTRLDGAAHLTLAGTGDGSGRAVLTADLQPAAADEVLGRALVAGINVAALALGGTLTLAVQRRLGRPW